MNTPIQKNTFQQEQPKHTNECVLVEILDNEQCFQCVENEPLHTNSSSGHILNTQIQAQDDTKNSIANEIDCAQGYSNYQSSEAFKQHLFSFGTFIRNEKDKTYHITGKATDENIADPFFSFLNIYKHFGYHKDFAAIFVFTLFVLTLSLLQPFSIFIVLMLGTSYLLGRTINKIMLKNKLKHISPTEQYFTTVLRKTALLQKIPQCHDTVEQLKHIFNKPISQHAIHTIEKHIDLILNTVENDLKIENDKREKERIIQKILYSEKT